LSLLHKATSFKQLFDWIYKSYFTKENHEKSKHQKPNLKQIPMTETQNSKQADV